MKEWIAPILERTNIDYYGANLTGDVTYYTL
jgi:hypothetical protein